MIDLGIFVEEFLVVKPQFRELLLEFLVLVAGNSHSFLETVVVFQNLLEVIAHAN
jgi:hypothetical protein